MAQNSIADYLSVAGNNTDIQSTSVVENVMTPADVNNAFRGLMAHMADQYQGVTALTNVLPAGIGVDGASADGSGMHIFVASAGTVTANAAADDLVVENSGAVGMSILAATSQTAGILFGYNTDNWAAGITHDGANTLMNIGTAEASGILTLSSGDNSEALRVEADGTLNVSGTTNYEALVTADDDVPNKKYVDDGGPSFRVYRSSTQSIGNDANVKIEFNAEDWDSDADFDSTTNYRFTPSRAGKYTLVAGTEIINLADTARMYMMIYKNGAVEAQGPVSTNGTGSSNTIRAQVSAVVDMNGSTDYVEVFVYHGHGSAKDITGVRTDTFFSGSWLHA